MQDQLDTFNLDILSLLRALKADRERGIQALGKERERCGLLNAMINAARSALPGDARTSSLSAQIAALTSALDCERLRRERCEDKLRELEVLFSSDVMAVSRPGGPTLPEGGGGGTALNVQAMNTIFALEHERAGREAAELKARELEASHRAERERLLSLLDHERQQLGQTVSPRFAHPCVLARIGGWFGQAVSVSIIHPCVQAWN